MYPALKKSFCHVKKKKEMIAKFKELTKLEIAKEGKKDLENWLHIILQ